MVEVGGQVDVPAEGGSRTTRDATARGAAPRRGGAGTTRGRRRTGSRASAGTQATLVPSSWRSGTSVTPSMSASHARSSGERQVGVGDDDAVEAGGRQRGRRRRQPPVEPAPGAPEHLGTVRRRPLRDLVVVAHHVDGQRSGRGEHAHRPSPGPARPVAAGSSAAARRTLAWRNALTGTSTAARTAASLWCAPCRSAGPSACSVGPAGPRWTSAGACRAADGSWRLDWWVGADRWRDPRAEVAVRHAARDGAPVFETALRVDGGDVRQRVYAAAESGGLVMVEVENDSPAPLAVAFLLRGASSAHADLPPSPHGGCGTIRTGCPAGGRCHASRCRIAACCEWRCPSPGRSTTWPDRAPSAAQVISGWHALLGRERADRRARFVARSTRPRPIPAPAGRRPRTRGDAHRSRPAGAPRYGITRSRDCDQVGRAAQAIAARCRRGMSSTDGVALVDALDLLIAGGDPTAASRRRSAPRPDNVLRYGVRPV